MKQTKPVLSRYEQYIAASNRWAKMLKDWELQPNMFGNEFDAGNEPGLAFDWSLNYLGHHIATPTGGGVPRSHP